MHRSVRAHLEFEITGPARAVVSVAVARGYEATETFALTCNGWPVEVDEAEDLHGTRLQVLDNGPGYYVLDYSAEITGESPAPAVDRVESLRYLRPSRYCESDILMPTARAQFAGRAGPELLAAVGGWVHDILEYVPGSSLPTDGAVRTYLGRSGVCRDFAHLTIAVLRALDIPARLVSVYAPGLDPMDFHAVAEGLVDGAWHVIDATGLAPRTSLVRIATGQDAADTAFLTTYDGVTTLTGLEVLAVVDSLPFDDQRTLTRIR